MSLDTLITKFTNFDQGTHGIEIMNKNDHVYNPLVEYQDTNDDIIYL
jgi:hypothetical protein